MSLLVQVAAEIFVSDVQQEAERWMKLAVTVISVHQRLLD